jgi:hypothetical protein
MEPPLGKKIKNKRTTLLFNLTYRGLHHKFQKIKSSWELLAKTVGTQLTINSLMLYLFALCVVFSTTAQ